MYFETSIDRMPVKLFSQITNRLSVYFFSFFVLYNLQNDFEETLPANSATSFIEHRLHIDPVNWSSSWPNSYSRWFSNPLAWEDPGSNSLLELNLIELDVVVAGESGHWVGRGPPSCLMWTSCTPARVHLDDWTLETWPKHKSMGSSWETACPDMIVYSL